MHRLNIFLSCFGPRAGQAVIFGFLFTLTLTLDTQESIVVLANISLAVFNNKFCVCTSDERVKVVSNRQLGYIQEQS